MIGDILTGGDLHAADLPVVGVVTQLHHTGELQLQSKYHFIFMEIAN